VPDRDRPLGASHLLGVAPDTAPVVCGGMWHVTVTVAGQAVPETEIRAGLERLEHEHPFLLAGRYAPDRAEVRYWEEAPDAASVVRLALQLWEEHRLSASLPSWQVVGVEVVDRETFHRRVVAGGHARRVAPVAVIGVTPF
jgi:hypothetical protein